MCARFTVSDITFALIVKFYYYNCYYYYYYYYK